MKQGDAALNTEVNKFLEELKASGKLAELYQKWMKLPLPKFPDSVPGVTFTVQ
ncbi:Bacterial extracellular solute-binding protein, family 3 [compost metagenome]